jgi:hypothetical protein
VPRAAARAAAAVARAAGIVVEWHATPEAQRLLYNLREGHAAVGEHVTLYDAELNAHGLWSAPGTADARGQSGASALAASLPRNVHVKALTLAGCALNGHGLAALCQAVREPHARLRLLELQDLRVPGTQNPSRSTLRRFAVASAQLLSRTLRASDCRLTSLRLSGSCMMDQGAAILASALCCNRRLQSLNLADNMIGCKGASALAAALSGSRSLTALDLQNNRIREVGASLLLEAMDSSVTSLRVLNLSRNVVSDVCVRQLEAAGAARGSVECRVVLEPQDEADEDSEEALPLVVQVGGSPALRLTSLLSSGQNLVFAARSAEGGGGEVAVKFRRVGQENDLGPTWYPPDPEAEALAFAPRLLFSGQQGGFDIRVVQLTGHSLELLAFRSNVSDASLAPFVALRLGRNAVSALEALHATGVVHGKIKACTLLLSSGVPDAHRVLLCGFDKAVRWRHADTGEHVAYSQTPLQSSRGMRGGASMHALLGRTLSRRDDLEMLAYALLGVTCSGSPWRASSEDAFAQAYERAQPAESICAGAPAPLAAFLRRVTQLQFDEAPNYDELRALLMPEDPMPLLVPLVHAAAAAPPLDIADTQGWLITLDELPVRREQRIHHGITMEAVLEIAAAGRSSGLYVSLLGAGTTVVLEEGTGFTAQVVEHFPDPRVMPKDWIVARWEEKYFITALASSGAGGLIVVMSRGTPYTQQSYSVRTTFPMSWVVMKWGDGFRITEVARKGNQWMVLMSRNTGFVEQCVELDCSYPVDGVRHRWAQGFRVTNCCTASTDATVVVMSKLMRDAPAPAASGEAQELLRSLEFPAAQLQERAAAGMAVRSLCFGRMYNARSPPPPGRPALQTDRAVIPPHRMVHIALLTDSEEEAEPMP